MKIITKKKERKIKSKECWNLDYELIKWLNEHLKIYKSDALKNVDLTFHKIKYRNKEYTQLEIIDLLIKYTDYMVDEETYYSKDNYKKINKYKNRIYELMREIHWFMWW